MHISKAASAADGLFKIIDRSPPIDALSESGVAPSACKGRIKLRSVRFAYPSRPDVEVLQGLDLDLPANKTTALVGASGSGKSTVIGMIERWYSPLSGSVTLDDHEVQDLNIQWLRTNVRLVQQVSARSTPLSSDLVWEGKW